MALGQKRGLEIGTSLQDYLEEETRVDRRLGAARVCDSSLSPQSNVSGQSSILLWFWVWETAQSVGALAMVLQCLRSCHPEAEPCQVSLEDQVARAERQGRLCVSVGSRRNFNTFLSRVEAALPWGN